MFDNFNKLNVDEAAITDEYIIQEAQKLQAKDLSGAKSWIIVGKILFPRSFKIQFQAYKFEKEARNYEEAAKCFGTCILNFPNNQNTLLWEEINELIAALRANDIEITPDQEFYVKMFDHVHDEVQSKLLMLLLTHTENDAKQCKSILLVLKRFPQVAATHMPRLIEMICEGLSKNQHEYQEMFQEIIPLMYKRIADLPSNLVCHLFTVAFEYYIRQLNDLEKRVDSNEVWDKIFRALSLCGSVLKWEKFLPFNKNWGQSVYWDKLIEIIAKKPTGGTHILFYATTLYVHSLYCYIKSCGMRPDDAELNHVLVEGLTDWKVDRPELSGAEPPPPPQISITTTASKEISKAFVNAAQCWQLLNTDQYQREFSQLLLSLPVAPWISRFLFDLAMYFGHPEEAQKLMSEVHVKSSLVQSVQILSLNLLQGNLSAPGFECILKIMADLANLPQGQMLEHLTLKVQRHIIFLPLTQSALVQYCARAIVNTLSRKIFENCPDFVLGDLLVLLQMDYTRDTFLIEQIFSLILQRRGFSYRLFSTYIVATDFLEEFMWIHNHKEDFSMDLSPSPTSSGSRRIGTRGVREDFRSIIKQQLARSNENLNTLVASFITQEHAQLAKSLFGGDSASSF